MLEPGEETPATEDADDGAAHDVGLVVVAHSRALAEAAVALAREMVRGSLRIEVAAGLDESTFGTDGVAIASAIEKADGPDGVVVLMDLGSAVLSTELALDLLADPAMRERVTLSGAPIVEGLVVAAVTAAGGAGRAEIAAEAQDALLGKASQLSSHAPGAAADRATPPTAEVVGEFVVQNPHGLHARPAARLVGEVRALDATVALRNVTTGSGPVAGASLSRVGTLGALRGHVVEVRASGPQAQEAVDRVRALAARRFDEPMEDAEPGAPTPFLAGRASTVPGTSGPLPASPGVAVGQARRLSTVPVDVDALPKAEPATEWRRLIGAVAAVRRDIEHLRALTARDAGAHQATIFDAHLSFLSDAELLADVRARVNADAGAVSAWSTVLDEVADQWDGLADPYLRERATDVRAVRDQVVQVLTGVASRRMTAPGVLVADDLTPAETAGLDLRLVRGVVLADGSPTSHAAILARARDIPAVVSAGRAVLDVPEGTTVAIDGSTGELEIGPSAAVEASYRERESRQRAQRKVELQQADQPALTRDGTHVLVAANLGSLEDAVNALSSGADGAGLVRTEFLFLERTTPPSIEEQVAQYDAIAAALHGRRVTLRTLDVGGDKPLPYLPMPIESNPFLGLRGIRLGLDRRDLLRDQLAAMCDTARRFPVSVMVPMVSTPDELAAARHLLAEAAGGAGVPESLRFGAMIEVPAAALKIEAMLPYLDFVSIGTNDLTQYTLAAERGNPAVAALADPLDPAVLLLVDQVCRAAKGRVEVAVCGEAASDPVAIPVLLGLGVGELSVAPPAVPRVKATVRSLDATDLGPLAQGALLQPDAEHVRMLVRATTPAV